MTHSLFDKTRREFMATAAASFFLGAGAAAVATGATAPRAVWRFYRSGSAEAAVVYADAAGTQALGSAIFADAGGRFPPVFLASGQSYRAVLGQGRQLIAEIDPLEQLNASVIGYQSTAQTATSRSVESRLAERLSVLDFGADPTGGADSHAAIEAARVHAGETGRELLFPSGTYLLSRPLQLGFARLHVRGEGRVVLQANFNGGNIVSLDAGAGSIAYQSSFRNFIIRGNGSAGQTGLFIRNMPHGVREDIRVRNVTRYAFHIAGDVFSYFRNLVSDVQNEGAGGEANPTHDLYLDGSNSISSTTACQFVNCILENGTRYGVYLQRASNNKFIGGGAEGLPGWGVYVGAGSTRNDFDGFYCEQNALGDFDVHGSQNRFINCEAYNANPDIASFRLNPGAKSNIIAEGGNAQTNIVIERGAEHTLIRNYDSHRVQDAGVGTMLDDVSDAVNRVGRGNRR